MAIENPPAVAAAIEVPAVSEHAIKAEAQRILAQTAAKHNVNVEDIGPEVVARAVDQAKANLEREAADESSSYRKLYEQERQRRQTVENTLESIRTQGQKHISPAGGPPVSAEQAKRRAGDFEWLHRMTPEQKISALGVDPKSVNVKEAAKIFGRNADTKLGSDLMKADPAKYRTLKQVAIAVGVYGA